MARCRFLRGGAFFLVVGLVVVLGRASADNSDPPTATVAADSTPKPAGGNDGGASDPAAGGGGAKGAGGGDDEDEELMRRLEAFRAKKRKGAGAGKQEQAQVPPAAPQKPSSGAAAGQPPPAPAPPPPPPSPPPPPQQQQQQQQQQQHSDPAPPAPKQEPPVAAPHAPPPPPPSQETQQTGANEKQQQGEPHPEQPKASDASPGGASSEASAKGDDLMDDLEEERMAFEAAERAVRLEEARRAAQEFAKREAEVAERLAQKQAEEARDEAIRAFNLQDMNRKGGGGGTSGPGTRAAQYAQDCPECPTVVVGARGKTARAVIERLLSLGEPVIAMAREERPGVMQIPTWFADIMVKAQFRGLRAEWMQGDATKPETLRKAFTGAKAVVFCAAGTKGDEVGDSIGALLNRDGGNMPKAVDNQGVVTVAHEAVAARVSRLIIISAAGAARPFRWSSLLKQPLGPIMSGRLKWKRQGELGAIEACTRNESQTTYTVVRAAEMGDSKWQQSFLVKASSVSLHQGDYIQGNVTRATVAATAVEAIFAPGARNAVFEVQGSSTQQRDGWDKGKGGWVLKKEAKDGEQEQSDRELEQLRWQHQFQGLSPGKGEFVSLEDQTRALVHADMETWIRAAEARKKHEKAPKLAPEGEPRPDAAAVA